MFDSNSMTGRNAAPAKRSSSTTPFSTSIPSPPSQQTLASLGTSFAPKSGRFDAASPINVVPPSRAAELLMWNMRRRHSSHNWLAPAARTAVKGARAQRAAKRACPLTVAAAEGTYARQRVRETPFSFAPLLATRLRRASRALKYKRALERVISLNCSNSTG